MLGPRMPLALTRRGWSFVIAALGLWLAWLAIGLRDLWYLVALLAAMTLLALLTALILTGLARFEVRISASDPSPTAGDEVRLMARIRQRLPMALGCRILWDAAGDSLTMPARIERAEPSTLELIWRTAERGPATAGVSALLVLDPLGLAARRIRVDAVTELMVLPRLLPALAEQLDGIRRPVGSEDAAGRSSAIHDSGSPGGAVRGYRSGDPQRRIHWKQSARQGELLVNLHEHTDTPERALRLVTAGDAYADGTRSGSYAETETAHTAASPADFERAVSAAATLAVHWIGRGHPVVLHVGDDPPTPCATAGEALRRLALARISTAPATEPDPAGAPRADAVVTGEVTARLAEELVRSPFAGALLALRRPSEIRIPGAWRVIAIPAPRPDAEQTHDAGADPHG